MKKWLKVGFTAGDEFNNANRLYDLHFLFYRLLHKFTQYNILNLTQFFK